MIGQYEDIMIRARSYANSIMNLNRGRGAR